MPTSPFTRYRFRAWHAWAGVAALVIACGAVGEWLQWPMLRAPLQRVLSDALQRPVELSAPFGVRLLGSLRIRAHEVVIGPLAGASAPEGADRSDLLRASDAHIELPYATLLRMARGSGSGALFIERLEVDTLQARLLRDASGRNNWDPRPRTTDGPAPDGWSLPQFGRLSVHRGEIQIDDALLELQLQAALRTREGTLGAQPGSDQPVGLDVRARGTHRGQPVLALLQASGLLPLMRGEEDPQSSTPVRVEVRAGRSHLLLDGKATDALQLGGLDAAFDLAGPSLAAIGRAFGMTLPTTAAFAMKGRVRKKGEVWSATVQSLEVGSSRLRGEFRFDNAPDVPLLSGTLAGERLLLADLGPAVGAGPPGTTAVAEKSARVLPQREFDIPSLRRMNADVELRLERLDPGTQQLESFAPLRGRVRLQDGVLSVQELLANTANGAVLGALSVDARGALPKWHGNLRWNGINLERFVRARNPRNRDAAPQPAPGGSAPGYVSGQLSGAAKVDGSGRSIAAVMATLDGSAALWVRDGRISQLLIELAGIDLAESLSLILTGDQSLPLRCAVAKLALKNGRAVPDVALIDTDDTTLLLSGQLSLADESLALVAAAKPHDVTPVALRGPVRIGGTFAQPAVRLDKRAIGLRLAGAGALALLAPPAALLALIDFGEDDTHLCREALRRSQVDTAPRGAREAPKAASR
jgi:uncharacterized protein involved in outer membrane biogenesis